MHLGFLISWGQSLQRRCGGLSRKASGPAQRIEAVELREFAKQRRVLGRHGLRLLEEGADPSDVDRLLRASGFKMGPFELMDLIGLDVNLANTKSIYRSSFEDPKYRPSSIQQRLVDSGRLGRKTGRGFYTYPEDS